MVNEIREIGEPLQPVLTPSMVKVAYAVELAQSPTIFAKLLCLGTFTATVAINETKTTANIKFRIYRKLKLLFNNHINYRYQELHRRCNRIG